MRAFISYSSQDGAFVRRLQEDLRQKLSIDVWLDQLEIGPGDMIGEKIEKGLSDADVFILVLSPDSATSRWVEYERQAWLAMQVEEEKAAIKEGRKPNRRLIPVLYRNCEMPTFLKSMRHVKITDAYYDEGMCELVNALDGLKQTMLKTTSPQARPPLDPSMRRKYIYAVLKRLNDSIFDEVVFLYDFPVEHLEHGSTQAQKAIQVIQYAEQNEGPPMSRLLKVISEVMPDVRTDI